MSILQHFVHRAAAEGLVLPKGGGLPSRQLHHTPTYSQALASSARMRQYSQALRRGQAVAGQRLDSAAKGAEADQDARYAAHVVEWASYLAADPQRPYMHSAGQRLDSASSVESIVAELTGTARLDALVPVGPNGLTSIIPDVYKTQHAGLPAWSGDILPIDSSSVDPAAENYTWYESDNVGVAKAGSTYSMRDIPLVGGPAGQAHRLMNILPFLVGMETNFMERRREAMSIRNGRPDFDIDRSKAETCQRVLAEAINALWLYGDALAGIDGLWNSPDVSTINLQGGPWSGKTPAQILADLTTMLLTIPESMQGGPLGGKADLRRIRIVLPLAQFSALSAPMTAAGSETILTYFLKAFQLPNDAVTFAFEFAAANSQIYNGGPLGLTTDHALVTYLAGDRWDPKFILPQPIEMPAPPKQTGMGETTFYHARAGGMMVADARRMRYVVGM